jgi:hemerythrin
MTRASMTATIDQLEATRMAKSPAHPAEILVRNPRSLQAPAQVMRGSRGDVMSFYDWTPQLDVHVTAMNDQHKHLIAIMNRLYDQVKAKALRASIGATLDELGRYTAKHFAEEEAYMASVKFPKLVGHQGLHRKLLERFGLHVAEFTKTGQLTDEFFNFLRHWLSAHIQGIDIQYAATAATAATR